MKNPAKTGLLTASLLLVGASVAGCSGGAPTDASEKEFCDSLTSVFEDVDLTDQPTEKEALELIKSWAKDLDKVGTPDDIPDEAREGFELMIKEVAKLRAQEDFAQLDADLSESEKKAAEAFDTYTTETCGPMGVETPELPELPTPS
jgi:hypothetical protein